MTTEERLGAYREQAAGLKQVLGTISERVHSGKGAFGEIDCPCCGEGVVYYHVAAWNGHARFKCSTQGCLYFIE